MFPEQDKIKSLLEASGIPSISDYAVAYFFMQKNEYCRLLDAHKIIEEELLKIVFGISNKNLAVCMPPRFGKSEFVIKIFVSWCLAFIPDCNFIIASNTLDLARSHVKAIRDTVASDWYRQSFPDCAEIKTHGSKNKTKTAVARSDFFETLQGGSVKGVGVGGLITGFGAGKKEDRFAGCFICDDLIKEDDFYSKSKRDAIYRWFESTAVSRRNSSKAPIILVMQRLHEDDIVGRLQKEESRLWNVIRVKAFDETLQKSVWEESIDTQTLLYMKNSDADIRRYMFAAKYQQEPSSDLNAIIKPEWWQYYDDIRDIYPHIYYRIITIDTACKSSAENDESVMQLWGFDRSGEKAYLLDMQNGRWEFPELVARTEYFFNKNNYVINGKLPNGIFIEDKASGTSLAQVIRQKKIPAALWNPEKNKISRVFNAIKYISANKVFLPKKAPFVKEFVDQCSAFGFDNTAHDDIVDAMTSAMIIWQSYGAK